MLHIQKMEQNNNVDLCQFMTDAEIKDYIESQEADDFLSSLEFHERDFCDNR